MIAALAVITDPAETSVLASTDNTDTRGDPKVRIDNTHSSSQEGECVLLCVQLSFNFEMSSSILICMKMEEKKQYIIAAILALCIAGSAAIYKYHFEQPDIIQPVIPPVGTVGSAHAHVSLLVLAKDKVVNFCSSEFMLKSQYVHFEDNDCYTVHRHATGVTIPTFFKTIGVDLTQSCLILPNGTRYCASGADHMSAMINGKELPITELSYYEFKNNDHILINYGPETGVALKFKYNSVPQIPLDVNEPLVKKEYGKVIDTTPLINTKMQPN